MPSLEQTAIAPENKVVSAANLSPSHKFEVNLHDALTPDPGIKDMFHRTSRFFPYTPGGLSKILNPKTLNGFLALGGLIGPEKGLDTNRKVGLDPEEFHILVEISFGKVVVVVPGASERIPELMWIVHKDKILILLTWNALISPALDLYETLDLLTPRLDGLKVVRAGKSAEMSGWDTMVRDVMHLEPEYLISVDGIFIDGHGIKYDEPFAIGESGLLHKIPADEVFGCLKAAAEGQTKIRNTEKTWLIHYFRH
ncbi:plasma membrane calcium [Ceratocystis pirilliformis]|uniref:Plasma membrane calcium n=1 Tax=Ceratocystis pirilliformis TaxID=259994 RepID=A0ABR3YZW3_9PEZI